MVLYNEQNSLPQLKARLVIQGYKQSPSYLQDFEEIYAPAPVSKLTTLTTQH